MDFLSKNNENFTMANFKFNKTKSNIKVNEQSENWVFQKIFTANVCNVSEYVKFASLISFRKLNFFANVLLI